MIPGSNILDLALSVINSQVVQYFRFVSRTLNANKLWEIAYESPILIEGSLQPVPKQLYAEYGLDLEKTYYTFYSSNNILPVMRDVSGDQLIFNNQLFQCEATNDWFAIDGWVGVLCVRLGATS